MYHLVKRVISEKKQGYTPFYSELKKTIKKIYLDIDSDYKHKDILSMVKEILKDIDNSSDLDFGPK